MATRDDLPDQAIAEVAHDQFGTISRRQVIEAGVSRGQLARRLSNGRLVAVHPGVFAINGAPLTRAAWGVAARLYVGPDAWYSHVTAARLHGFEPLISDQRIWLTIPVDAHRRPSRPGIRVVRSRRIGGFTTTAHGQPLLSAARTVVDLAGVLDDQSFRRLLYDVIGRSITTTHEILGAAEDFGGRPGISLVRRTVNEFDPEFGSELEEEADELFRSMGLIFKRQIEVTEDGVLLAVIDFGDEDVKFGIEIDGARYHSSTSAASYDRERDRMLRRRGWHIERLTTDDIRRRGEPTVRHVMEVYRQRRAGFRSGPGHHGGNPP